MAWSPGRTLENCRVVFSYNDSGGAGGQVLLAFVEQGTEVPAVLQCAR